MNLIIWAYLALTTWPNAFAMYYTGIKELFQSPVKNVSDSYFGYSITYDEVNEMLIISAPRESDIGVVYKCNIKSRTCTPIHNNLSTKRYRKYKHDYWFGATVKAGPDFVLMCAPRFTKLLKDSHYLKHKQYGTTGKCYSYATNRKNQFTLQERKTISNTDRLRDLPEPPRVEQTMDSFGWSIDVASDSAIVGGPGMFHGRTMIYGKLNEVPKLIEWEDNSNTSHPPEFNFGYAVASGKFINDTWMYAVSSPYGTGGHGEVLFYEGVKFQSKLKQNPSQVGSMFGGVLCAAKLLGARTDLLVGAPTYALDDTYTYNLGAVYVYLARTFNETPELHRKIVGEVSGSMFGSAIISVGDLNGDEKDEIVIGAPFEKDGHGAVYLYSGADLISKLTERDLKFLQRIEPETSYGESFGMSLTPLPDYDNNGCKELAIGSPYKDTVVFLRCMAAVVVETSATFPDLQRRNSSQTDFEFEVCLSVQYPTLPQKIIALVSTTVELEHESAKLVDPNNTGRFMYETSLDKKEPKYCKMVSMFLPPEGKYETKISFTISSKLRNDPKTLKDFNSSRVILSDRSTLTIQASVWAAECAGTGNQTCVPNLTLSPYISFNNHDNPYIIGSSKTETLRMSVHNDGEVAYDPCVRVRFTGANVFTTPSGCVYEGSADGNKLVCEPAKPIRTNKTWTTGTIELEMTHLTNLNSSVFISMLLFNRCEDVFTQNISIIVPVKADPSGISAIGETDIRPIVHMTKEDIELNGKKMQHVYKITNKGPTNWNGLQVQVTLQTKPYINYGDTPVTVFFSTSDSFSACTFMGQNGTSMSYLCKIESLMKEVEYAKIIIPMYIVPETLDGLLDEDKNVTIMSSVKIQFINDDYKVESITTTITLQEATVPIETVPIETVPVIISVVIGLCIIIITTLILYRVGFLRRKKREELNKLKSIVKRQTILRHSTMLSQPPQSGDGDQRQNLETMQEEAENNHTLDSK